MNTCECGCGQKVVNRFVSGHNARGTKWTEERVQKWRVTCKTKGTVFREGHVPWNKGKKMDKKYKENVKKYHWSRDPLYLTKKEEKILYDKIFYGLRNLFKISPNSLGPRICLFCGSLFYVENRSKTKFCSSECMHRHIGSLLKKDRVQVVCPVCKKEFERLITLKQTYCSVKCKQEDQKGKKMPLETIRKRSETIKRYNSLLTKTELSQKYNQFGDDNPAKRPEVREKISQSKIGSKNPMKRPEVRKKVSIALKKQAKQFSERMKKRWREGVIVGHPCSEEQKRRISEMMKANNPMSNPDVVAKRSLTVKGRYKNGGNLGRLWREDRARMFEIVSKYMKTNNPMKDPKTAKKVSVALKIFYRENISKCPKRLVGVGSEYDFGWCKELREEIKKRDRNRCTICTSRKNLRVHHVDHNKKNSSRNNLVTLCVSCHMKVHYNMGYRGRFLQNLVIIE